MGYASMNRYWNALARAASAPCAMRFHVSAPWQCVPVEAPPSGRLGRAIGKYVSYPCIVRRRRESSDLVHVLDHSFAGLLRVVSPRTARVVTVHDLVPLEVDEGLSESQVVRFRRGCESLQSADWLVCDSEHTRCALERRLGVTGRNVAVIPLGVDMPVAGEEDERLVVAGLRPEVPFALVVGGVSPRKNLSTLVRLMGGVRAAGIEMAVVKVGAPLPPALADAVRAAGGTDGCVAQTGRVSDATLAALYRQAAFTFVPSTYEGFGLPVLEAMAHGCPVVCSNATSLPEVGGDAVLYFSPDDVETAVAHGVELLKRPERRAALRKQGCNRARAFSWQAHWEKLGAVYAEALATRSQQQGCQRPGCSRG